MKKISKHLLGLFLSALCLSCAFEMPANAGNSYGIDADAPEEGQEDVITYSGKEETYEVKVTGIYDITACGGQGGKGLGYVCNPALSSVSPDTPGAKGSMAKSRTFLKEGTKLTVHVGSVGGTGHLGHHSKEELWAGSGGWSDGGRGETASNYDSNTKGKDVCISTGGGGGSTYLIYEGEKVLSAAGGSAAQMTMKRHQTRTRNGGAGGGSTFIKDAGDLVWKTDEEKKTESGVNGGDGKIVFRLVRPRVGIALHADTDEWTKENITVSAEITSEGEGVPDACFYWEYEPKDDSGDTDTEGAPLGEWTDADSITVHANGTVNCKIRDVNESEEEASLDVTNIDRKGPRIGKELSPDDWTMEPVTLTIKASDDGCGVADDGYLWSDDTALSPDDEGDYELQWNATTAKTYDENASVTVIVRDKLGNRTEQKFEIANIDRTAPTVRLVHEGKWKSGEMTFMIEAEDLQPDGKTPGSGLPEDAYSVDGENYTNERTILVTEPGTVTVWVRDKLGNLTESHISVSYDKEKNGGKSDSGKDGNGGKSGKGGKGGKSGSDAEGGEDAANPAGEGTAPLEGEMPVQIPGIDATSALGNINLDAAKEALQAGRRAKRKSATGAEDEMRYGVVTKEEEPAFSEIVKALSGGDEMQIGHATKGEAGAGNSKNGKGDGIEPAAGSGLRSGLLASVSAGAKWVMRIIQKWKHVITYSLGALISFSLLGLGAVFFLVWKRKKRN